MLAIAGSAGHCCATAVERPMARSTDERSLGRTGPNWLPACADKLARHGIQLMVAGMRKAMVIMHSIAMEVRSNRRAARRWAGGEGGGRG